MRRRIFLSFLAALSLAACAHEAAPPASPEMAWSLSSATGEGAKLAFGQPQTDNVLVMLTCQPRSGEVLVSMSAAQASAKPAVHLRSNGHAARLPGTAGPSMLGGVLVEGVAQARDPVFDSFARSGQLTVGVGGLRTALPAGDRGQIRRFVETCRPT